MEIKNLKKAAARIKKAIKSNEDIILYGDADMDGISSVIILKEAIENLGGKVRAVYFPDREKEGYGLNKKALADLKKYSPALLISLDCGIGNFEEVETAKEMGFEVIIIDHHEILGRIPNASIVVDPKQPGDKYPFKQLAAAGLAFKLSEHLLGFPIAFKLLTCSSINEAKELAAMLFKKSVQKKEKIKEIISFLEEKISGDSQPIVFEGSSDWQLILLGTAASVISQKYQKPVFLYKKREKESVGSIRAPKGVNVVEAMKHCSKILITYGGHPQAAGFRVKNKNLNKFKECLIEYFK